jgi:phage terminase large subunit
VEEAHSINRRSMEILIPTVLRKRGSEIWWTWNPTFRDDPVDAYFRASSPPPPHSIIECVGPGDNPWFFQSELAEQAHYARMSNPKRYEHIWNGGYDENFDRRIFDRVSVGRLDVPEGVYPLYGMDFGFGGDPNTVVKAYVMHQSHQIYVAKEGYSHCSMAELPELIDEVIDDRSDFIRGDSSNPGAIGHLNAQGFNIGGARKAPGSVKAGISWLQGFEIVVAPECEHTLEEAKRYQWAVDAKTDRVLSHPLDKWNHIWDALRYATEEEQFENSGAAEADSGVLRLRF